MSELLLGGQKSGTPLETQGGARDFAGFLQNLIRGGGGDALKGITDPFTRLINDALMASLGGSSQNAVISDLLADPADRTRGLFASMVPFEAEETERQVSGVRNIFGTAGGRFSRNVATAEASTRGRLGAEFQRGRQGALLEANAQRGGVLANLMQHGLQRAQLALTPLQLMAQFFQPGAPVQTQGILPGLLSAGINLFGISKLGAPLQAGQSLFQSQGVPRGTRLRNTSTQGTG